jgi:CRISPR-associated exonuclease Cas4
MIIVIIALFLAALILLWISSHQRKSVGLPQGRVISADSSLWGKIEKPLYDPYHRLTGRPDYVVQHNETIIPVEVKASRASDAPYESHIYQLAAYCLLIERTYGSRPTHGILHYPNVTFAIDYTPELEANLINLLTDMRVKGEEREIQRSHSLAVRCRKCGFYSVCDQAL